eukprot:TRINITY_DN45433_c0_g1_i1.p1 TRINITY_DN45433_c0_g1~~TRINITY_DN45433_c0_g1_i1.p1  ORF type:complete len:338 (-),score=25.09 TRINITY_DN45433_c0_g1_i1:18-1031(-)
MEISVDISFLASIVTNITSPTLMSGSGSTHPSFPPYRWTFVALSAVQAVLIGLPSAGLPDFLRPYAGRGWAIVLPVSIGGVVSVLIIVPDLASWLTWLALVLPIATGLALGWAMHGAQPYFALLAVPIFICTFISTPWVSDLACLLTSGLGMVFLGRMLVGAVTTVHSASRDEWKTRRRSSFAIVRIALVGTAAIDCYLVFSDNIAQPNENINKAVPVLWANETTELKFPSFQNVRIVSESMGAEDIFVPAVLGALLAEEGGGLRRQWTAVGVEFVLALAWGCMWMINGVSGLPCTVSVGFASMLFWGTTFGGRFETEEEEAQTHDAPLVYRDHIAD